FARFFADAARPDARSSSHPERNRRPRVVYSQFEAVIAGIERPRLISTSGAYDQLVVNPGNAGSRPCGVFGDTALPPASHLALQGYLMAADRDGNVLRLQFCAAAQGSLDLFMHAGGIDGRGAA